MKGWLVIHKIKSLYDSGNGLTERKIAKELGLSRNTVSRYLKMPEPVITVQLSETDRTKKLDEYRSYIVHLLQTYPGLSAVKVLRKLKAKVDPLDVSERSVRRYIQALKAEISVKQPRYYEPVIDMMPGVLSYSRLMHVYAMLNFKLEPTLQIAKDRDANSNLKKQPRYGRAIYGQSDWSNARGLALEPFRY